MAREYISSKRFSLSLQQVFTSKGSEGGTGRLAFLTELLHWELLVWGGVASFFLLRFFSLVRAYACVWTC